MRMENLKFGQYRIEGDLRQPSDWIEAPDGGSEARDQLIESPGPWSPGEANFVRERRYPDGSATVEVPDRIPCSVSADRRVISVGET
jgi:hypothetical protein